MTNSPIEEIKGRLDIVEIIQGYIKLQKAGANYRALCPFHSEKKPSFFVSPGRQTWKCFGCSLGGDIFSFIKAIEGVEFGDALRILAERAGVELKREDPILKTERHRLYEITGLACLFFEKQLQGDFGGREAKKYLLGRGISEDSVKKWRLGYAPDVWRGLSDFLVSKGYSRDEISRAGLSLKSDKTGGHYDRFRGRIIFPVFNSSGHPVGFGGRVFKQTENKGEIAEAKYINSPATLLYDKGRILYGLEKASVPIRRKGFCVLVEGYMDVILAFQAGFENAVASSGTALTFHQLKILKRYSDNLFTAFDMDIAGDSATKRGIDLAQQLGFSIKVVTMPEGKDPADVIAENPSLWEGLISKARSIHDFYFETTLGKFDKNTLEGKKSISKIILPAIKKIPSKIEQSVWIRTLSDALSVKEEDISEELKAVKLDSEEPVYGENVAPQPFSAGKTRKELLEERMIILAFISPSLAGSLNQDDYMFFSPQTLSVFDYIAHKEGRESSSPESGLADLVSYFEMRAEAEPFLGDFGAAQGRETDLRIEFQSCFNEIRALVIKDKLDTISKEIKKAENQSNKEGIESLIKEFNETSSHLRNLETA